MKYYEDQEINPGNIKKGFEFDITNNVAYLYNFDEALKSISCFVEEAYLYPKIKKRTFGMFTNTFEYPVLTTQNEFKCILRSGKELLEYIFLNTSKRKKEKYNLSGKGVFGEILTCSLLNSYFNYKGLNLVSSLANPEIDFTDQIDNGDILIYEPNEDESQPIVPLLLIDVKFGTIQSKDFSTSIVQSMYKIPLTVLSIKAILAYVNMLFRDEKEIIKPICDYISSPQFEYSPDWIKGVFEENTLIGIFHGLEQTIKPAIARTRINFKDSLRFMNSNEYYSQERQNPPPHILGELRGEINARYLRLLKILGHDANTIQTIAQEMIENNKIIGSLFSLD